MPKISVSVRDSNVLVDGVARQVISLGTIIAVIDPDIEHIAWNGMEGTIHYTPAGRTKLKQRLGPTDPDLGEEAFSDFSRFQSIHDAWIEAAPPPVIPPEEIPKDERADAMLAPLVTDLLIETIEEELGKPRGEFRNKLKQKIIARLP